jgi:hypothetical protein
VDKFSGLAQAVTAVVALVLAYRAFRVDKDAPLVEVYVRRVMEICGSASSARTSYLRLLKPFHDYPTKEAERTECFARREQVRDELAELAILCPAVKTLVNAWQTASEVEDSHIHSQDVSQCASKSAEQEYLTKHTSFVEACAEVLRTLKTKGLS